MTRGYKNNMYAKYLLLIHVHVIKSTKQTCNPQQNRWITSKKNAYTVLFTTRAILFTIHFP